MRLSLLFLLAACSSTPEATLPMDAMAPPSLSLAGPRTLIEGETYTFEVRNARYNQDIRLYASPRATGPQACPTALGTCLDLRAPAIDIGTTTVNGFSIGGWSITAPVGVSRARLQAVRLSDQDLSNTLGVRILPPAGDADGDGLSNRDEVHLYGTDPLLADTDGGGVDDGTELAQGYDPHDPDSEIQPILAPSRPCPAGTAAYTDGTPWPTMVEALDDSGPNSTIEVCPGTWISDRPLTFRHAGPLTIESSNGDPASTRLSGGTLRRVFKVPEQSSVTFRGLGFVHGWMPDEGAAIQAFRIHQVLIDNCLIQDNKVGGPARVGFGITAEYPAHGAVVLGHRNSPSPLPMAIRDSTFRNNISGYSAAALFMGRTYQGAITFSGTTPALNPQIGKISNTVFEDNSAAYEGGAAVFYGELGGEYEVENSVFRNNRSGYDAGAVYMTDNSNIRFIDTTFEDNESRGSGVLAAWPGWSPVQPMGRIEFEGGVVRRNSGRAAAITADEQWQMMFTDVDMGTGADDNSPRDVENCGRLGMSTTTSWDYDAGVFCP